MMWMLCLNIKLFEMKNMALLMITPFHKCICLGTLGNLWAGQKFLKVKSGWFSTVGNYRDL